jgi:RimJ/RimL family protein N-acetyltransferase
MSGSHYGARVRSDSRWPGAETIVGARVVLTPVEVEDAPDLARALDDPALHEFTGGEPATEEHLRTRFEHLVVGHSPDGAEGWLNWVVRGRGPETVVGTVQATLHRGHDGLVADVAWVVGVSWQGQGLAKEAAGVLCAWLWTQGATEIAAYIHPDHDASAGVARSVGMTPTDTVVEGEIRWRTARP